MSKGFTVIELVVAILIVGILTAVAMSSYQDYSLRIQRADAKSMLLEVSGWMERNHKTTGRYDVDPQGKVIGNASFTDANGVLYPYRASPMSGEALYNISFSRIGAQAYTVQAVPSGADELCGALSLDQQGTRTISGTGTVADCWQR